MTDRTRRRLMAAGAVLVVVVAAGVLLPQVLLPRERLAGELTARVRAATGGELDPGGLGVRLLGGPVLVLRDGTFTRHGADGSRVAVEFARVEIALTAAALVRGEFVVGGARISGPVLAASGPGLALRAEDYSLELDGLDLDLAAAADEAACDFRLGVATLHQGAVAWEDLRWEGRWDGGRTSGARASVRMGEGRVEGTLDVDYATGPRGRIDGRFDVRAAPAALLLGPLLPDVAARLETDLDGELAGGLELGDAEVRARTLAVEGELRGGPGVLRAEDWLRDVVPYLGDRGDLVTVRFERLDHRFVVRDGRYASDRLELDGDETDWQARGWLEFGGDLAVALRVRLPAGFTPDLGAMSFLAETLRDGEGRIDLGLRLTGPTAAPRLGVDFSRRP